MVMYRKRPHTTQSRIFTYQTILSPLSQALAIDQEADFAENDGIPRSVFYNTLGIYRREATVQAVLNTIPDLMLLIGRGGIILDFKVPEGDDGWPLPDDLHHQTLARLLPPDLAQRAIQCVEQAQRAGAMQVFDYQLQLQDQLRDYEARCVSVSVDETLVLVRDVTSHKQALRQLRELSQRLQEVQENERRVMARELHDEIGQVLTGLELQMKVAHAQSNVAGDIALSEARALVRNLIVKVRNLSQDLRPPVLDDLGLLPAVMSLVERYINQAGMTVTIESRGLPQRFTPEVETAAYRIIQEALTNVMRHAGVSQATLRLEASPTSLRIQAEDRGRGFDPNQFLEREVACGLSGMRERARLAGGWLTIESTLGQGTRLLAELPVAMRSEITR